VITVDSPESFPDLRSLAREALDAVLAGDRRPTAVEHPLEFVCIPILRSSRFGICGHIWRNNRSALTIHCHSWHLHSDVVAGAVRNEVFAISEDARGDHVLLAVDSTGQFDQITSTGTAVMVRKNERTFHEAGTSYTLRAGVFHRSTPMSTGPTLTLLAATVLPGARDQILARRTTQHQPMRRKELPVPEARAMAELLRNAIDSEPLNSAHAPAGTPPRKSPVPYQRHRADRT
jgi:hypothetical protein